MHLSASEPITEGGGPAEPEDRDAQYFRFLSSVSQTLRTPLTAVLGFAEVLRADAETMTESERDELIAAIASQAAVMSDTVDDFLVAAQAEVQSLGVAQVPVDLRAQVAQVIERTGTRTALRIEGSATALGDPRHVRHIIRNLLRNAECHGGPNTLIRLSDHHDPALLSVTDDGPGIPAEDQQRIFQPFEVAHHDEGQPDALGLGLSLARRLARLMEGDLIYRYEVGHSTFTLSLPAHRPNGNRPGTP